MGTGRRRRNHGIGTHYQEAHMSALERRESGGALRTGRSSTTAPSPGPAKREAKRITVTE
ncbi:hypothetical protein GCM10009527_092570 [Actinomadura nitritigenes]